MGLEQIEDEKKSDRGRRLSTLSAIRKEICRVYAECRESGPDPAKVQFYRALTFILGQAATVRRDEALEDMERRLEKLEEARK